MTILPDEYPIAGREQRYAIRSCGVVINLANNKHLQPICSPNGYLRVGLANGDGSLQQALVHRLVASHFLPNPAGLPQVNHKNGDKTDNSYTNLEWCTSQDNNRHALKTGLRPGYMSADTKDELIDKVLEGELIKDLAREHNRGEQSLSAMLRKRAVASGKGPLWRDNMRKRRSERTTLRNKGLL